MQLRIRASPPSLAPGKHETLCNSYAFSRGNSIVSICVLEWIYKIPDATPPDSGHRAKIPASTIQNTEAGIELRWFGTEVVVRKYYLGK
jgi:hypothetical protein